MYLLLLEIYSENYYYDEEVLVLLVGSGKKFQAVLYSKAKNV
jgi:hypothetical protein